MKTRIILALLTAGCARSEAADHTGHAEVPPPPAAHAGHGLAAAATSSQAPAGYAHVALPAGVADRLDLTTTTAEMHHFRGKVRAYGAVVADETRTSHVHAKVRGWIDTIAVNFTGEEVKAGQTLCAIYSPEVYSAQLELLSMLASPAATGAGEFVQADRQVRSLIIAAARRRLALWDVPPAEIQRLIRTRQPLRTFTLLAPRTGTVVAKQALAGLYADVATELYTLSDLSRVWVQVDVYAPNTTRLHVGDAVRLTIAGLAPVQVPVAFVSPTLDAATRTVQARLELDNADRRYRPGDFAIAELDVDLGEGLGVPDDAIVRTGTRNLVFVVLPTHVEPREVQLGDSAGGWTRVLAGVQAGELVASRAAFLLDSESRIRGSSGGAGHAH